jgi:anti-sigma B factor antagonist
MNFCGKWRWPRIALPFFAGARRDESNSTQRPDGRQGARQEPCARPAARPCRLFGLDALTATPLTLNWQESKVGGVVMVKFGGDIDLRHSPKMRRLLQGKACARTPALLLDFTGVNRMDSSGLATLLEYYQYTQTFGGRLAVTGLTGRVQSLFHLARFHEIFAIHSNVAEAMKSLQPHPLETKPV